MRNLRSLVGVLSVSALAACTVTNTDVPPLSGPSEMALGVSLQAVPDSILQDGGSQSSIMVEVHGPSNTPVRALPLRAEIRVDGIVQDFGSLSSKTMVTGDDGRARVVYTAPPPSTLSQQSSRVTIAVVPIGGDYRGETFRTVDIRLVPQGVIGPSNPGLVPKFTFEPKAPTAFSKVNFDASETTDNGVRCGAACSYSWNFGDGSNGSGLTVSHEFRAVSTFLVTLTVADARGATAVTSQSITVGAGTPPTATFRFSPTTPGRERGDLLHRRRVEGGARPANRRLRLELRRWQRGERRHREQALRRAWHLHRDPDRHRRCRTEEHGAADCGGRRRGYGTSGRI